jgi:hypothetical protein
MCSLKTKIKLIKKNIGLKCDCECTGIIHANGIGWSE